MLKTKSVLNASLLRAPLFGANKKRPQYQNGMYVFLRTDGEGKGGLTQ